MRKLTIRGMNMRRIFEGRNFAVKEVYPGGAQDILGIPRKQRGLDKLVAGLESLGIRGLNSRMSDHELDAVTCAYVGKLFLEGKSITYGTAEHGIVMPAVEKTSRR
jgi:predicted nuclease with RNAse H fold